MATASLNPWSGRADATEGTPAPTPGHRPGNSPGRWYFPCAGSSDGYSLRCSAHIPNRHVPVRRRSPGPVPRIAGRPATTARRQRGRSVPGQVRERQFRLARRGLDPNEVHGFLDRVAYELATARPSWPAPARRTYGSRRTCASGSPGSPPAYAHEPWAPQGPTLRGAPAGDLDQPQRRTEARPTLGRSITFLPDVDAFEAEVSEEDNQGVRHQVFCNRLLARNRRCELKAEHAGDCAPRPRTG